MKLISLLHGSVEAGDSGLEYCSRVSWSQGSQVAQWVKNPLPMQEMRVRSLGWEDTLEEGMRICPSIFAGKSPYGQRSLVAYSPWGHKESDSTEATEHSTGYSDFPF